MTESRERIRAHVERCPGVHFTAIVDQLDLATGQVQYHLRRLQKQDSIVETSVFGQSHYYPPEYDASQRRKLALLRRETSRAIVVALIQNEQLRPIDLADELDLARSTVSWQLDRLESVGLVERGSGSDGTPVTVVEPDKTTALLREVSLARRHRIVDRFTAFVDDAFEQE